MPPRVARRIIPLIMLMVLCSAVATVLGLIVVSTANVRDELSQAIVYAVVFLITLVAGLVRLPLGKRS